MSSPGLLGFIAYMTLFISIFYWSLRWLGPTGQPARHASLRRAAGLLQLGLTLLFYFYDGSWRFFGVAVAGRA